VDELFVVRGGHVIDPASGYDGPADVVARGPLIAEVLPGTGHAYGPDVRVMDVAGLTVTPGLVDLHCHLRCPGQEHKEDMASGSAAAARGGYTTICCMPNTRPPLDTLETVTALLQTIATQAVVDVRIIAALSLGQEGRDLVDMRALAEAGAVAYSDDGKPVRDVALLRRALREAARVGRPLSLHEEEPRLAGQGVLNAGRPALLLGLPAIPAAAEETMIARDLDLLAELIAEGTRPHLHLAHVSTAGGVELVRRAKAAGLPVTAEVTPHHLTLTDDMAGWPRHGRPYDTATKVNPPLRSAADVQALGEGLRQGIIDVVATDHAPHASADKDCSYEQAAFGISNFETALASCLEVVRTGVLSLPELVNRMTARPATLFGLSAYGRPLGQLIPGARADLIAFAPHEPWRVEAASFASRGHNTPLEGQETRGRVCLTIASGQVVYRAAASAAS